MKANNLPYIKLFFLTILFFIYFPGNLKAQPLTPKDYNLKEITLKDLGSPVQDLDLWTGVAVSSFIIDGKKVTVTTICHPEKDVITVKAVSDIEAGEELFINYNGDWNDSKPVWFETSL